MLHDGFAALTGEVVDFLDLPAPAFGIASGALLVMFGAIALGLIFGGNSNPDANVLGFGRDGEIRLHGKIVVKSTTQIKKNIAAGAIVFHARPHATKATAL